MKGKPEPTAEQDDAAEMLQQAATLMAKAAEDRANRPAILKEVEASLSKLRIADFPDLAESPVVQAFLRSMDTSAMRPGEARNKGTLAEVTRDWTMEAINEEVRAGRMGLVRFTPAESIDLTFQGVKIRVTADKECEIPDCFADIYREHRRAIGQAVKNEAYLLGHSDTPPDPAWQSPETARVRAWSLLGRQYGRPGGTLGTGRITEPAEEQGA